jgi:hypothetical protein
MKPLPFRAKIVWLVLALLLRETQGSSSSSNNLNRDDSQAVFRAEASVLGESALIDKETGRIFWEGGSSNTLSEHITPRISPLRHTKASFLSACLLLSLLSSISRSILNPLLHSKLANSQVSRPFLPTFLLSFARTILRLPRPPRWLVALILVVYLVEAFFCSTRQYLAHKIGNSDELEAHLEQLRRAEPIVEWKVRSFHYEVRPVIQTLLNTLDGNGLEHVLDSNVSTSLLKRKKVTHRATGFYQFNTCEDQTFAGVWKKATRTPIYSKIAVTKIIVLKDAKARIDYFRQQSEFLRANVQNMAEFSTSIHIPGYRSRILAIRHPPEGLVHSIFFRQSTFWIFTLFLLTVPYRHWLAAHCDDVRVTIVKMTGAEVERPSSYSWGRKAFSSSSQDMHSRKVILKHLLGEKSTAALTSTFPSYHGDRSDSITSAT